MLPTFIQVLHDRQYQSPKNVMIALICVKFFNTCSCPLTEKILLYMHCSLTSLTKYQFIPTAYTIIHCSVPFFTILLKYLIYLYRYTIIYHALARNLTVNTRIMLLHVIPNNINHLQFAFTLERFLQSAKDCLILLCLEEDQVCAVDWTNSKILKNWQAFSEVLVDDFIGLGSLQTLLLQGKS